MSDQPKGCLHREHKGAPTCSKMCDAGQDLCPHHLLLSQATAEKKPPAKADSRTHRTPRGYEQ